MLRTWGIFLFVLSGCVFLMYPFLNNPLFFDDQYFFQPGNPERFFADGIYFSPRWWVHETFAATYVLLGKKIFWLRLGNLFVHVLTAAALVVFLFHLLRDIDRRVDLPVGPKLAAVFVAGLFLVHPLAIFTQGYLIQRTILCATLFSVLSLLAFWRGLAGSRFFLWGSCVFFALGVLAKEHAVMLPLAAFLLLVLRVRSGLLIKESLKVVGLALLTQGGLALFVVLHLKGLIGEPYEIMLPEMLQDEPGIAKDNLYGLSVLSQAGLFFKYLGLWIFPSPTLVSVDIREPFPLVFSSWGLWCGALFFIGYVSLGLALLWRGGGRGLFGLSLLLPAVLFFTEFSVVRLQEPFVIYRSYLWAPFFGLALALILRRIRFRLVVVLFCLFGSVFFGLSFVRLSALSHPVLIWREAADVYESQLERVGVFGGYRIYYNLGTELHGLGYLHEALDALNRSVELKPTYAYARSNRGGVFFDMGRYLEAQADYEAAIKLMPENLVSWNGLARTYKAQGKRKDARFARREACLLRGLVNCE